MGGCEDKRAVTVSLSLSLRHPFHGRCSYVPMKKIYNSVVFQKTVNIYIYIFSERERERKSLSVSPIILKPTGEYVATCE